MLRRYGSAAFMELYRSLPTSAGPSEVDAAIQALYGLSAEELWQSALAARPGCIPLWPCSRPPLALDGSTATVGTQCGLELDYLTLAAPDDGNLLLSTVDQRGARLLACDERVPPGTVIADATLSTGLGLAQVDAGPYYLELANRPTAISATFATEGWAGPDCAQLQTLTVPSDPDTVLRIVMPPMTSSWFVKLRFSEPRRFAVGSRDTMTFSACAGCTPEPDVSRCRSSSTDTPRRGAETSSSTSSRPPSTPSIPGASSPWRRSSSGIERARDCPRRGAGGLWRQRGARHPGPCLGRAAARPSTQISCELLSRLPGLNRGPTVYETVALPLS